MNDKQRGELLRKLRKAIPGMSQMKLAEKVGVSYQQIQKYEKGSSTLSFRRIATSAAALNVEPAQLVVWLVGGGPKDAGVRCFSIMATVKSTNGVDASGIASMVRQAFMKKPSLSVSDLAVDEAGG